VAFVYVVAQLVMFDTGRALEWDEAEYLAEVHSSVEPIGFSPHRSRGLPLLVAPLGAAGASVEAIRVYLIFLSGIALFVSFTFWRFALGWGLPVASAFFAGSWLVLFYGSEISPNLWVAFAAVALTGAVALRLNDQGRHSSLVVPAILAFLGLMRPSDAVLLGFGSAMVAVIVLRARSVKLLLQIAAGLVAGWLPWLVEAFVRFGGVRARLEAAERVIKVDGEPSIRQHLALFDGPLMGPEAAADVPLAAYLC
jgi:hypothetical protein